MSAALEPASLWTNEDPRLHLSSWEGDGTPLLLVHGMAAHEGWWRAAAARLAGPFTPAALDFRGHGESQWRPGGDYDTEGFVADIEEARHALGWGRMVLAGHSLGARVALEYARRHPDRLLALAAVDFLPELRARGARRFERPRSRPQPHYRDEASILDAFRLQPPATALEEGALRELGRLSVRRDERGWTWKYDWRAFRYRYEPVWPLLREVRVPALVVRGEHSTVLDRPSLERVVAELPDARSLEVPGAHHHVPLDAPEALAEALLGLASGRAGAP